MPTVRKSVIVAHPRETMFDLVDRAEDYPRFLPWCSSAEVFERTGATTRGRLGVDYHGLRTSIETLNHNERPEAIDLTLVEGPFEHFTGRWTFRALGESGCRVELAIDYAFASPAVEVLMGRVFGHITQTLVDRFVARADEVAG